MFTQHIPRTGNPVGKSIIKRSAAGIGVVAITAGLTLVGVPAATAATVPTSFARAQFLSGTVLGSDLANLASLAAATAQNNGSQVKQTSKDPLNAEVIQTINVDVPKGIQLDLGSGVDAGVINQYAEASKDGSSLAAAGAIGDDGAIGVGSVGSGAAGDLTVDLDSLLGNDLDDILADLKLTLNAVSAQAEGDLTSASGDYTIADAKLTFSSPAIADLTDKVKDALSGVDSELADLGSDNGVLGNSVDKVLDPILKVVDSSADVKVVIDADVEGAVESLLDGKYGNGAVSFNLQTGKVTVDLEKLLGGNLNNLPANTELLDSDVIIPVLNGVTDTVGTLADQIVNRVEDALHDARVEVHAGLKVLTPQEGEEKKVCETVKVPIIGDILDEVTGGGSGSGSGGGLGDLLGGVGDVVDGVVDGVTGGTHKGIIGYTTEKVCKLVEEVLPDLKSTVDVDITATVDQLLAGTAAKADADISLLGGTVKTKLDVDLILDSLGAGLNDGLFDSDSAISDLIDDLNDGLVEPAVEGLLGDTSVSSVLTDLVSVKANVQEITKEGAASVFTETAVQVSVAGGDIATVNVAQASVGPNVTEITDPPVCETNCGNGDPDPDPCTVNCGNGDPDPGPQGDPDPTTAAESLAYTGVGIATLIAVILALLAAGAYMAREGYRRNHPKSLTTD